MAQNPQVSPHEYCSLPCTYSIKNGYCYGVFCTVGLGLMLRSGYDHNSDLFWICLHFCPGISRLWLRNCSFFHIYLSANIAKDHTEQYYLHPLPNTPLNTNTTRKLLSGKEESKRSVSVALSLHNKWNYYSLPRIIKGNKASQTFCR